jgi:hypothetical protein
MLKEDLMVRREKLFRMLTVGCLTMGLIMQGGLCFAVTTTIPTGKDSIPTVGNTNFTPPYKATDSSAKAPTGTTSSMPSIPSGFLNPKVNLQAKADALDAMPSQYAAGTLLGMSRKDMNQAVSTIAKMEFLKQAGAAMDLIYENQDPKANYYADVFRRYSPILIWGWTMLTIFLKN